MFVHTRRDAGARRVCAFSFDTRSLQFEASVPVRDMATLSCDRIDAGASCVAKGARES